MVEEKSQWTAVAGSSCLLTVHFIEHTVHKVAKCFQKEEPTWDWYVTILQICAEAAEENDEWEGAENEAD